jgi:2-keto-3-deoxy-L-rhamnonate aldolase RhmA
MTTVRNVAREKLDKGHLSLGVGIRMTRSVEIAKAMAVAGFDWLFLDMEHGVMSLEACAQISSAALDAGIAPIARVPNREYAIATRALTTARSASSCRMSIPRPRRARWWTG